ncbi:MAG: putative zinc-binding metallopeptidase [Gammaproteobacteria bacterium]
MKRFSCNDNEVFFENTVCLATEEKLGFIPEVLDLCAITPATDKLYRTQHRKLGDRRFRKCANYQHQQVCNWMVAEADPEPFCLACRLNKVIPDLSKPENRTYWREIEQNKRRLIYTLLALGLPLVDRNQDPEFGLAFAFLADATQPAEFYDESAGGNPIMTGHNRGLITINIAEADPRYREQMRMNMNESYRTLIGHFRHEVGHYYWYRLIFNNYCHAEFVQLFGDETIDYQNTLQQYYTNGPAFNWWESFISAYASSHPWEDWAECWAHYLHIIDTLETAQNSRLLGAGSLLGSVVRRDRPLPASMLELPIKAILDTWVDLSIAMNNINRSIGLGDFYPFVISPRVMKKLEFIHRIVSEQRSANATASTVLPIETG